MLNYGWMGTIAQLLAASSADWLAAISQNYQRLYQQRSAATQQQAWLECCEILQAQLSLLVSDRPSSRDWTLIFEYELPREGGRRPDLVLLASGQILVFEFKQKAAPTIADLDQVSAYARDLAEYHSGSSQNPIEAILIPTRRIKSEKLQNSLSGKINILSPSEIKDYLITLDEIAPAIDPIAWVTADYEPLPTVVEAARRIFQQEPLPNIKTAQSAGIPDLIAFLDRLVAQARQQNQRHLVLITGVPGSGKTLVGLQFVYQSYLQQSDRQAVFLSGNAPLIAVLQYALKSRVFVQAIRNFYITHEVRQQKAPKEHVLVFDEAQRAWDLRRMNEEYGIDSAAPGTVLKIAERSPDWCVLLGLIGEGQEIHVGEEEGIGQWNLGLQQMTTTWQVHCPPAPAAAFSAIAPSNLHPHPRFDLTTSLRTHLAKAVQTWVTHLLASDLTAAAALLPSLTDTGYTPYVTRDLETAKAYCRDRYQTEPDKRYGLVASSRARNLSPHGIDNGYMATQRVKMGAWYVDPVDSSLSCCALSSVVTEFGCQGLELDLPIIGWGDDLLWQERWVMPRSQKNVRDPLRLRLNSYRVLLTRGRDGFIIFVPPEAKMDSTFAALRSAGLPLL